MLCFGCSRKGLEYAIEEFKKCFKGHPEYNLSNAARGMYRWNWDDSWDGTLVRVMQKLEENDLKVIQFWRSRKIKIRYLENTTIGGSVDKINSVLGIGAIKKYSLTPKFIQIELNPKFFLWS